MDYEQLYTQLSKIQRELKDKLAASQTMLKKVAKESESGDLKSAIRDIRGMEELIQAQSQSLAALKETAEGFDGKAYFENGDFEAQLLQCCQESGVDVKGTFPVYEMFPYRVRLDAENQDVYINRKKLQCMRPSRLVATVKANQEKQGRGSFNAQGFLSELCDAYDMAILKDGKRTGADIYLSTIYKLLVPMSRSRREYDQNSFAFDLARLFSSGEEETKTGRRFQFGTSRNNNRAFRILDSEGREQFLATICFYKPE